MEDVTRAFVINSIAQVALSAEEELKSIKHTRFFAQELEKAMATSGQRIFLVCGLRGTGKTISLYQLLKKSEIESSTYFSCDELLSRNIQLEDAISALDQIKKETVGIQKKFLLLLDEVTYLPAWDLKLKVITDRRPKLIIVATSSSALPLRKTTELTRRAYEIHVFPLSFREYLAFRYDIVIPEDVSTAIREKMLRKESVEQEYLKVLALIGSRNLYAVYEEYCRHDLPFAQNLSEKAYSDAVNKLIKRTIYEDFSKFENFETKLLIAAEVMINYLSTIPADAVKISSLAEVTGISKESVVKLLDTFELAMVTRGLENKGRNRVYKKPKKWFFYSPSMRYVLASPVAGISDITGNLREDSVFRHLVSLSSNLFYSKDADFIINDLRIEVGKNKKPREDTLILEASEFVGRNRIPIPIFALSI